MVSKVARVLKMTEGAGHVCSWVLGDAVPHVHINLVPRYPGTPNEYRGFRVVEWPDANRGGVDQMGAVCDRLRRALSAL